MPKRLLLLTFLFIPSLLASKKEYQDDYHYEIKYTKHLAKYSNDQSGDVTMKSFKIPNVTFFHKGSACNIWDSLSKKDFQKLFVKFLFQMQEEQKELKKQDDQCYFALIIKDKVSIELSRLSTQEKGSRGDDQTDPIRVCKKKTLPSIEVSFLNNQKNLKGTLDQEGSERTIEQFIEIIHVCSYLFSSQKDNQKRVYISLREGYKYRGTDPRNKAYILCDGIYKNIELNAVGNNVTVIRDKLINKRKFYLNNNTFLSEYMAPTAVGVVVFIIAYILGFFSSSETENQTNYIA